jgi:hypothetical protein
MSFPEGSELLRPQQGVEEIRQQGGGHEQEDQRGHVHGASEPRGDARVGMHGDEADEDEHDGSDIAHGMLRVDGVSFGRA